MDFLVRKFEDRDAARVSEIMYESFKTVFKEMWEKEEKGNGDYWKEHAHAESPTSIITSYVAEQADGTVIG